MPPYRVYYGDHSGKIFTAVDIEAADEEQAIADATVKGHSAVFEVWKRGRLVRRQPNTARLSGGKPAPLVRVPAED